ncbi:MAG: calcium/proton exchanger [Chloroflexi bacterium]|nr:calcium/proton exchanger [Chloroflexota bacterium]
MKTFLTSLVKNPLAVLLLALPLALAAELANLPPIWVFIFSAVGVIPMAGYIGEATEVLATIAGPRVGGLLNATLGNAAELIITLVAIRAGLLDLVKASITGSIIGNLLLVMGFSMVVGGLKHGLQTFDRRHVGNNTTLLAISALALAIPSIFSQSDTGEINPTVEALSLGVALVMIVLYATGMYYSLRIARSPITYSPVPNNQVKPAWSLKTTVIVLAIATAAVVWLSELLVGAIEPVVADLGVSEFFLGIILVPIVGNAAEHLVAVQVAYRNHMELSVEIAISSSLQIALFVAPVLVFVSLGLGHPLTLVFNVFELIALGAAVLIAALVSADGESNWLEGAALLAVYLILGLAFYLMRT